MPLTQPAKALLNHARVHALTSQGATLLGWCLLSVVATGVVFLLPDADGFITLPFRNFVPAGVAVSTVGYSMLPAAGAYPLVTTRLARARHASLAAAIAVAALAVLVASWAGSHDPQVAGQCARSVLIWSALAITSTRLWGRVFGWVLPLGSIALILFWGRTADHTPRWFNWSDVEAPATNAWISLAITAGIALLAIWLTNWRRYTLRTSTRNRRRRGRPENPTRRHGVRAAADTPRHLPAITAPPRSPQLK